MNLLTSLRKELMEQWRTSRLLVEDEAKVLQAPLPEAVKS